MAKKQHGQTGPKTVSGKQTAAQNSTDHGLCATGEQLLPGETEADRAAVAQRWADCYYMDHPGIAALVEHHVVNDRLLRLASRQLIAAESKLAGALIADFSTDEITDLEKRLHLIRRYKTTHERSFQRSLRNLEQFDGRRAKDAIAERRTKVTECKAAVALALKCGEKQMDLRKIYKDLYENDEETDQPQIDMAEDG